MKKSIKLSDIKTALNNGYLPPDWLDRARDGEGLIRLDSGYIALLSDTTETEEGSVFHSELDSDCFGFDERNDVFRDIDNLVRAYGRRGREITTNVDDCEEYRGEWYVLDYLADNEIYRLHNGELCHSDDCHYVESEGEYYHDHDCYYWESDGEYHLEEETEANNTLWGYGNGPREKCFLFTDNDNDGAGIFGWGCEIEKNALPPFDFNRTEIYDNTGAVLESDSSVSDGFELKTPVYNLFSAKTIERLKALEGFCNVKNNQGAGGHIGFSMEGKNDEELLDLCRGFLPLIYAMHKKRLQNSFCTGKKVDDLKADGSKYQSIRLRGNYIEFRIFGAVRSFDTLLFRLDFFRIMAGNLGANFSKVLLMAVNINHPLNKLLCRVYGDRRKFMRLITDAVEIDRQLGAGRIKDESVSKLFERIEKNFAALGGNITESMARDMQGLPEIEEL